jgi:hypothetical protein
MRGVNITKELLYHLRCLGIWKQAAVGSVLRTSYDQLPDQDAFTQKEHYQFSLNKKSAAPKKSKLKKNLDTATR